MRIAQLLSEIARVEAASAGEAGPADNDHPAVDGWEIKDGKARAVTFVAANVEWDGEAVKVSSIPAPDDWGDFFAGGGGKARNKRVERTPSYEEAERVRRALAYIERRHECAHRVHRRISEMHHRFFFLHPKVRRCWDSYYGYPRLDDLEAVEAAEELVARASEYSSMRAFVRALAEEAN